MRSKLPNKKKLCGKRDSGKTLGHEQLVPKVGVKAVSAKKKRHFHDGGAGTKEKHPSLQHMAEQTTPCSTRKGGKVRVTERRIGVIRRHLLLRANVWVGFKNPMMKRGRGRQQLWPEAKKRVSTGA